jgi:hypothetical protein
MQFRPSFKMPATCGWHTDLALRVHCGVRHMCYDSTEAWWLFIP